MIHLERISRDNWREATFVTTDPKRECPLDQEWVTSTAFSIVQSVYEPEWENRLVMDDDMVVILINSEWMGFQPIRFEYKTAAVLIYRNRLRTTRHRCRSLQACPALLNGV